MQSLLWEQGFCPLPWYSYSLRWSLRCSGLMYFWAFPFLQPRAIKPFIIFLLGLGHKISAVPPGRKDACFRYRLLCPRAIALASPGEALFFLLPSELPRMFDFILRAKRLPVCPTEVDEFCFHSSPRISYGLMVVVVFSWGFWKTEFEASPSQFTLFFSTS